MLKIFNEQFIVLSAHAAAAESEKHRLVIKQQYGPLPLRTSTHIRNHPLELPEFNPIISCSQEHPVAQRTIRSMRFCLNFQQLVLQNKDSVIVKVNGAASFHFHPAVNFMVNDFLSNCNTLS